MAFLDAAVVLVLLLTAFLAAAQGSDRTVVPLGNSSDSLTEALESLDSNAAVYLELGEHRIERFRLLQDLTNVSIIGLGGSSGDVVVSCAENVGLAFVNVSELTLENLRIEGCGISQENLNQTVSRLREIVLVFYRIPNDTYIGLFLGHCENVVIRRVAVTNTTGLGMVGINVIGNSRMSDVNFIGNIRPYRDCNISSEVLYYVRDSRTIGGGAFIAFLDYQPAFETKYILKTVTFDIERANFIDNSECTLEGVTIANLRDSALLREQGYGLGGGGGLSLIMAQQLYGVVAGVSSTLFSNNTATFGGGALAGLFTGVVDTLVSFSNCTFSCNGFLRDEVQQNPDTSYTLGAGGLAIANDILLLADELPRFVIGKNVSVTIEDTDFFQNGARSGGGVYVLSTFLSPVSDSLDETFVYFNRCTFDSNAATSGAALLIVEYKLNGLRPGIQIIATDVTVRNNEYILPTSQNLISASSNGAAVFVIASAFIIQGNSIFDSNLVSAIECSAALLGLNGNVTFIKNTGVFGGAIYLTTNSHIVLSPNSSTHFIQNVGRVAGGAIYVYVPPVQPVVITSACVLFFGYNEYIFCVNCLDIKSSGIYVEFLDNSAPSGGILFGTSLENCPWASSLRELVRPQSPQVNQMNVLEILHRFFPENFKFDPAPSGITQVQTPTTALSILDQQDIYEAIPGQSVLLNVSTMDGFMQDISSVITSYVVDTSSSIVGVSINATLRLGTSGFVAIQNKPTVLSLTVLGAENQLVDGAFYALDSGFTAQTEIFVQVQRCPNGFKYNDTMLICVCLDYLQEHNVQCDTSSLSFVVPEDTWLGPVSSDGELSVETCLLYCNRETKTVNILNGTADYDSQCASGQNRGGVGCGSCRDGYSLALGSTKCLRCSNLFVLLLIVFALSGILLVATIAYFRITIAYGFLNGMLFYSNIVSLYNPLLTPSRPYSGRLIFTSFLTLNFGIESCFHDNFTALERVGWQLIFPLYLFILMLIIAFLARFLKFKAIGGQNIIQAFSTLMLLVYVSVLQACVDLISVEGYNTSSGSRLLRWRTDPSVAYYSAVHGFLATVAILLLLLYIIPFPIILLFPSFLYGNRRLGKFKPFYDAFWNPFKPTHRIWLGLRLIFRWIPFTLAVFVDTPANIFITGLLIIFQLIILMGILPFQSFWVNVSDSLFLTNLIVLFMGSLFFQAQAAAASPSEINAIASQATSFSTVFVIIAYLQFTAIVFYHLVIRFKRLKEQLKKLYNALRRTKLGKKLLGEPADDPISTYTNPSTKDSTIITEAGISPSSPVTFSEVPPIATFTELREPLVEDEPAAVELVSLSPLDSSRRR